MIHLWDEFKFFLLSPRYDPLHSDKGEAGMPRDDESVWLVSSYPSNGRLEQSPQKEKNDSSSRNSIRHTFRE